MKSTVKRPSSWKPHPSFPYTVRSTAFKHLHSFYTQEPVTQGCSVESWWKNSVLNNLARATEVCCMPPETLVLSGMWLLFCYCLWPVAWNTGKIKHTGCIVGGGSVNWGCVGRNLAPRNRQRWVTVRKLKVKSWRCSLCTILICHNIDTNRNSFTNLG